MAKAKFNFDAKVKPVVTEKAETADINLSVVSKLEKTTNNYAALESKLIPRNRIKKNPKNKAPMTGIESLMESILQFGLQQPLTVIFIASDDVYVIEAGHRRTTCIDKLIETYKEWDGPADDANYHNYIKNVKEYENGYPCIIKDRLADSIDYNITGDTPEELDNIPIDILMSEIRILITNNEVRSSDDPDGQAYKQYEIVRLSQLYESINRRSGSDKKINVNETIADKMGISSRQVINYKNVSNLIPELQEAFKNNDITLTDSKNFQNLSEEEQHIIADMLKKGTKLKAEEAQRLALENKVLMDKIKEKENALNIKMLEAESLKTSLHAQESEINSIKKEQEKKVQQEVEAAKIDLEKDFESKTEATKADLEKDYNLKAESLRKLQSEQMDNAEKERKKFTEQLTNKEKEMIKLAEELDKLKEEQTQKEIEKENSIEVIKAEVELKSAFENVEMTILKFKIVADQYKKIKGSDSDLQDYVKRLSEIAR